jgi:DNA-binding Xre family transcriptional regulator
MTENLSAKNLRAALRARTWSQADLAREAGIDEDTVVKIFKTGRCSTRTFQKIVKALGRTPASEVATALLEQ